MGAENRPLHIFLFPFLAQGHLIPTIDMAKLFAARGVKATILSTPLNAPLISKSLPSFNPLIHIQTIHFPFAKVGFPQGFENMNSIPSPDLMLKFFEATTLLQEPLELVLQHSLPDCLVADMFFPWATHSAAKFGIPAIVFHGTGLFALCASECLRLNRPYDHVSSDSEPFVIPNFPCEITMTRSQVPDFLKFNEDNVVSRLLIASKESELTSYGVLVNSFYELEEDYADHYRTVLGRKSWHIGPLSLCNTKTEDKAVPQEHECFKWLDTKKPSSVVYVCFGSVTNFPESLLREIAIGLEASGQQFIWVVRKPKKDEQQQEEEWVPKGFEKRLEGKGLIIRGWAPQVKILEHEAVGAFVTHCGWNSTLESVCAGVPMVTWPVYAEQFYNEKLVSEVLKIGVPVGVTKWARVMGDDSIKWEAIEKAVNRGMQGEEAEEMRNRAEALALKARKAVEKGGTSYSDLNNLIQDLNERRRSLEEIEH
ncbi:probable UDP-glucosyl transferase 73B6 [Prosopis cineraria]|uniref:probable UDP-glucosyl transferase 73B6 n=1 Tax=Prosopis cineraria TaxID=364024 RepID=UPI002410B64F|nr:probable UDP-glucosyl transferase 73B6 [Prosopis cineraria]